MMALANKTILVTDAPQGLGKQVAEAYTTAGTTAILVARYQKHLEKVYDAIVTVGSPEPFAICFDLMNAEGKEFKQFAETIGETTDGKLDGVMHCVSYLCALSPLDFQTISGWVNQYRINTAAPIGLTHALFSLLKQSKDISVIFVNESHGEKPRTHQGGFRASKVAPNYLCKVTADEWERFDNLRANVLMPGAISSPQRVKSRPGGSRDERKNHEDVLSQFIR